MGKVKARSKVKARVKARSKAKAKRPAFDRRWRKSSGRVQKKCGSPFIAIRVPRAVLVAFKGKARAKKATPQQMLREYMAKVGGVELQDEDGAE